MPRDYNHWQDYQRLRRPENVSTKSISLWQGEKNQKSEKTEETKGF